MNFIGTVRFVNFVSYCYRLSSSIRPTFFLGLLAGGPAAIWYCILPLVFIVTLNVYICRSSFVITVFFMVITAAVLAEVCSALPLSGSIYVWAAESAGPKYARFFGFIVAWWVCAAWMTYTAGNSQVGTCPLLFHLILIALCVDDCKLYRFSACRLGD